VEVEGKEALRARQHRSAEPHLQREVEAAEAVAEVEDRTRR
jgi:hypothetical protein